MDALRLRRLRKTRFLPQQGQLTLKAALGLKAFGNLQKRAIHALKDAFSQSRRLANLNPASLLKPAQLSKASGEVALKVVKGPVSLAHASSLGLDWAQKPHT
ncbi:hypothetical protein [Humidesulfovibrio sp.]|uniref:hypothetical protein n=1 Tax=Humidesulfovibrio sp. TaxID=2910988 RepID=UPI002733E238|nr:hypothetical protein [Humidesulfovibrio sp.]